MKFLADMGISPRTAAHLQQNGHDARHLRDEGLERLEDSKILEKARAEARILLAHDHDFGELLAVGGWRLPSVVIFRLRNMRPENVNRYLDRVISNHVDALDRGNRRREEDWRASAPEGQLGIAQRFIAGWRNHDTAARPGGTLETPSAVGLQSSLRDARAFEASVYPAMNRWAIIRRPSGTKTSAVRRILP